MGFSSVEDYMSKKTQAIICFCYFPTNFRSFLWQQYDTSSDFDKIKFKIQN